MAFFWYKIDDESYETADACEIIKIQNNNKEKKDQKQPHSYSETALAATSAPTGISYPYVLCIRLYRKLKLSGHACIRACLNYATWDKVNKLHATVEKKDEMAQTNSQDQRVA